FGHERFRARGEGFVAWGRAPVADFRIENALASAREPWQLRAMVTYETEIIIDAPPEEVWRHLTDFDQHERWTQHFVLRGRPEVGTRAHIEFSLLGRRNSVPVRIERADEPRELRWRGGPKGIVDGSHFFLLEGRNGNSQTRFRHGEDFSGVLAPVVWAFLKAELGPSYSGFNEDLKRRAEPR
ncbi:MAG: SRPBCC domain-containing protein, partial [Polyangiales bacterium]